MTTRLDTLPGLSATPMTRALSILLIVGQVVLALSVILLLGMALVMFFPSGFRDSLFEGVENAPAPNLLMWACLAGGVIAATWFYVLVLLRRVVVTVIHGDPFLPANVARLRMIWIVIAGSEIFRMLIDGFAGITVQGTGVHASEAGLDIRIGTWFFIFVIAAISEAFRHGAALRDENELTI